MRALYQRYGGIKVGYDACATEQPHAVKEGWRRCAAGHGNAERHEEVARLPARRLGYRPQLNLERIFSIEKWLIALPDRLCDQRPRRSKGL